MKIIAAVALTMTMALAGCGFGDSTHRNDPKSPGEAVGQAAYDVKKGAKKAVNELDHDLKSFSRDAREGYQQEKSKDTRKAEDPRP